MGLLVLTILLIVGGYLAFSKFNSSEKANVVIENSKEISKEIEFDKIIIDKS